MGQGKIKYEINMTKEYLTKESHNIGASLVAQTVKNLPECRIPGLNPWVRMIPWRKEWLPTPVFLPGEFHGQRSLGGLQYMGLQRVGCD